MFIDQGLNKEEGGESGTLKMNGMILILITLMSLEIFFGQV